MPETGQYSTKKPSLVEMSFSVPAPPVQLARPGAAKYTASEARQTCELRTVRNLLCRGEHSRALAKPKSYAEVADSVCLASAEQTLSAWRPFDTQNPVSGSTELPGVDA